MENEQRTKLLNHLRRSEETIQRAVSGVDSDMWLRVPGDDRWSIGQCAEHIVTVEERILGRLKQFPELPVEPYDEADSARKDELVLRAESREQRFQAPPMLHPKSQYQDAAQFLKAFEEARTQTIAIAQEFPEWLRGRFFDHPALKKLDGYQWLTVVSAHGLRHAAQIEEIKQELRG